MATAAAGMSLRIEWERSSESTRSFFGSIGLILLLVISWPGAAEAASVLIQSAPGRFEISAVDPTIAHRVADAAEEGWRLLAGPLALPDGFTSPVFVRIIPAVEMLDAPPFGVTVEVGGIVSVRLRADAAASIARRALVQALLMRLAVAQHGINERLTVPL